MIRSIQNNFIFFFLLVVALSPSLVSTSLKNIYAYFLMMLIIIMLFLSKEVKNRNIAIVYGLSFFLIPVPAIFNTILHQEIDITTVLFTSFRFMFLGVCFFTLCKYSSMYRGNGTYKLLRLFIVLNFVILLLGYISPSFNNAIFFLYYNQESYDEFYAYMLGRPGGLLGNPNTLAMSMVFVLLFFLPQSLNMKFRYVYIILIVLIILFTKSRTGLFGLTLGLSCYFVLMRRLDAFLYFMILIGFSIILGGLLGYLDVNELIERYITDVDLSGRDSLWIEILRNPFFSDNYLLGTLTIPEGFNAVDNEYLNILVRYGVIGLVVFLLSNFFAAIYYLYLFSINVKNEMAALSITCIFVFLVFCLAGSPLTSLKLCFVYLTVLSFFTSKSLEYYNESISYGA